MPAVARLVARFESRPRPGRREAARFEGAASVLDRVVELELRLGDAWEAVGRAAWATGPLPAFLPLLLATRAHSRSSTNGGFHLMHMRGTPGGGFTLKYDAVIGLAESSSETTVLKIVSR